MINILIVDDNMEKINDILEELKEFMDSGEILIDYEFEIKKACAILEKKHFDVLILDVQLPSLGCKDGISKNGGIDLLKIIDTTDRIKKPSFIIGLTAFDENYEENIEKFEDYLWLLLKYDKCDTLWRKKIASKVEYLIKSKIDSIEIGSTEYVFDCAIITAVENEFKSFYNCGVEWKTVEDVNDSTIYYEAEYEVDGKSIRMALAMQHQMGMVAASTLSMKLIERYKPKLLCMVGITGGRKGEVDLGDIIIASETWDYGSGKIKKGLEMNEYILEPAPHQIAIDSSIKEYLMSDFDDVLLRIRKEWNRGNGERKDRDIKLHVGPLGSGAAVIQNENIITNFIQPHNRKVLGIDMETYAVYYTSCNAKKPKPKFVSIKAVSDFANQYKDDGFQQYSAYVSTKFCMVVLKDIINRIG